MKTPIKNDTILGATLENASKLKVSDIKLKDMMKEDSTSYSISQSELEGGDGKVQVKALYTSSSTAVKRAPCKSFDSMPYHPLPNAVVYGKPREEFNGISAIFGEMEREKIAQTIVLNGRNNQRNMHIKYRFNLLGIYRDKGDSRNYGHQARSLLKNKTFQIMAFNHVCSGFATNMSINESKRILQALEKIIQEGRLNIPMKRVYIEKANGKGRPLGVPEVSGRVYLHMGNCLIVGGRTGKDKNHAYFPGKGTHTAGQEALPKLLESKNIYEFDLTSFFPSVNLTALQSIMVNKLDIPLGIASHLIEMHRSITVLPKEQKLPEESDLNVLLGPTNEVNPNLPTELKKQVSDIMNSSQDDKLSALKGILPKDGSIYRNIGVPQGTATSCGMATISLHYVWELLGEKLVMYADDGILFPEDQSDIPKLTDKERGITVNEDKSGGVKQDGKGLKDSIKFLGLRLKIAEDNSFATIESATRKNSDIIFTKGAQFATFVKSEGDRLLKENAESCRTKLILKNAKARYRPTQSKEEEIEIAHALKNNKVNLIPNQTVSEGIVCKGQEGKALSEVERQSRLFSGPGLSILSQLYTGVGGKLEYQDVKQYVVGSGLQVHGPRIMYEGLLENGQEHLTIEYWRRALKERVHKYLPGSPLSIGKEDWMENLPEDSRVKLSKLREQMREKLELIKEAAGTPTYEKTLNSLFQGNRTSVDTSRENQELRKSLSSMLRGFPLNWNSMSTIATDELLMRGSVEDRRLRKCLCTRTKNILVKRIPRSTEGVVVRSKEKDKGFHQQYNIKIQSLIQVVQLS